MFTNRVTDLSLSMHVGSNNTFNLHSVGRLAHGTSHLGTREVMDTDSWTKKAPIGMHETCGRSYDACPHTGTNLDCTSSSYGGLKSISRESSESRRHVSSGRRRVDGRLSSSPLQEVREVQKELGDDAAAFSDVWSFCGSPESDRWTWDTTANSGWLSGKTETDRRGSLIYFVQFSGLSMSILFILWVKAVLTLILDCDWDRSNRLKSFCVFSPKFAWLCDLNQVKVNLESANGKAVPQCCCFWLDTPNISKLSTNCVSFTRSIPLFELGAVVSIDNVSSLPSNVLYLGPSWSHCPRKPIGSRLKGS